MQTWSWCRFQHYQGQGSQKTQNQSPDLDVWPWKSRSNTFLHDLSYLRLQSWYAVNLSVDSNIFEIEDIKNVENKPVTLTVDLETQGHTLFYMTLLISGCMSTIDSILVSNLTYSRSRISENLFSVTWPWCLTSIFKVKPFFFKYILFSRSFIIDTLFISDFSSFSTSIMLNSILESSP